MANPLQVDNLVGTLVCASATSTDSGIAGLYGFAELNINIGQGVANSASLQSANIHLKSVPQSAIFLVKMSSGTCTVVADRTTDGTTPTFISANAISYQAVKGEPVYLGPLQTVGATTTNTNGVLTVNSKDNVVALKITNNSGTGMTVAELRLLVVDQYGPQLDSFDGTRNATVFVGATLDGATKDASGSIVLNT